MIMVGSHIKLFTKFYFAYPGIDMQPLPGPPRPPPSVQGFSGPPPPPNLVAMPQPVPQPSLMALSGTLEASRPLPPPGTENLMLYRL